MRLLHLSLILASAVMLIAALVKPAFLPLPWYGRVALIAVAVGLGAYEVRLVERDERWRALRHMAGRPALTEDEFGRQFFPWHQAELASKLCGIMARHIALGLSRLDPDDRMVEDLRMDALDSMATVEFILEVEKEFGLSIPDAAAEKMRTLRDVVEYVTRARGTAPG